MSHMRVFRSSSGVFKHIKERKFENEKTLQTLIEKNLDIVFDGLEFLTSEFQIRDLRPDSVAYDSEKNCFVIIEYKNIKNKQVLDQGATYYRLLKEHMGDFVLLYNRLKNQQHKTDYFNWDESHVIFLSPEFTKYQIGASGIGLPIQLHQVVQHDDGIITMEQIGDAQKRTGDEPYVKTIPKNYVRLDEYSEEDYLNGKYTATPSKETRELYFKIKGMILGNFEGLEARQRKLYVGFYLKQNDACVCTLVITKSKIQLKYSTTVSKNILSASEFVQDVSNIGGHGVGHYMSVISSMEDMKQALPHIRTVYDYKTEN